MMWTIFNVYCLIQIVLVHTYDCCSGDRPQRVWRESYIHIDCKGSYLNLSQVCEDVGRKNITEVSISHCTFQSLGSTDFIGCENVKELGIIHGSLSIIEDNAFVHIKRLQVLDLRFNNLSNCLYMNGLPCSFNHLKNLGSLFIHGNINRTIENGSYPNLSCLKSLENLNIDGMFNTKFGHNFQNLKKLHNVSMSGLEGGFCDLRRVENETFEGLKFVKNLTISHCNLTGFDAGALVHLTHLERLDISYNQRVGFAILPNVSFGLQFTKIKSLNVSRLFPSYGDVGTMLKKRHICYLWKTSLEEFDLSGNNLELLETNVPIILPLSLSVCHVNYNRFRYGAYLAQNNCYGNLTELYLNKDEYPLNNYKTEPLLIPNLDNNDGSDCPFMDDSYVRKLSQLRNNCKFIKGHNISIIDVLNVPQSLKKVESRNCKIFTSIDAGFPNKNEVIEHADFSGCFLFAWNVILGHFKRLRYFDLSYNLCSYVKETFFSGMPALETLLIQGNYLGLSRLSKRTFWNLTSLKTFNISSNRITSLPETIFAYLYNIETIDLSDNKLQAINFEFRTLYNLSALNVSNNVIRNVPPGLLNHLSQQSARRQHKPFQLDLTGNVLMFSCDYLESLHLLVKHKYNCINFDNYTFEDITGRLIRGKDLPTEVAALSTKCSDLYNYIIAGCSAGFTIILLVIVGGCVYKHRWKLRFKLHTVKRRYFAYKPLLKSEYDDNIEDDGKRYDAFISYAEEDVQFIRSGIVPELEDKGFKLCIHQRDFVAGKAIADNIVDAINSSKKTIAVISENYVRKRWCIYEFQMARLESIYNRNNSLLVVMLENVPADSMQLEMIDWIGSESYLEYTTDVDGNVLFWDRLRAYLREALL